MKGGGMASSSVPKLVQEAVKVKEVLDKIGQELAGGVSSKALGQQLDGLNGAISKLDSAKAEVTKLVNMKKESAKAMRAFLVKAKLAIKVQFGSDSSEYEMAGGTRASDRKRPVRKAKG
jgi:hypothetical protein